jgi:hypothetical protein
MLLAVMVVRRVLRVPKAETHPVAVVGARVLLVVWADFI